MFYACFTWGIEGIPFIIRFKTIDKETWDKFYAKSIEGIPFIIRFKTFNTSKLFYIVILLIVLKVFHL